MDELNEEITGLFLRLWDGYERRHIELDGTNRSKEDSGKVKVKTVTVEGPLTPELAWAHLNGKASIGVAPVKADSTCRFGVLDIDWYDMPESVVVMVEAALTRLLRLASEWTGERPDDVSVTFSRDFIEVTMDPAGMVAQMKLWQSGAISRQTLYENLQQGEIARADRSYLDEKEMIEEEGGDLSPIIPILKMPTAA